MEEMDKCFKIAKNLDNHSDMTREELQDIMDIAATMADRMEEPVKEKPKPEKRFIQKILRKIFKK